MEYNNNSLEAGHFRPVGAVTLGWRFERVLRWSADTVLKLQFHERLDRDLGAGIAPANVCVLAR